jgi:hypothetical protein
VILNIFVRRLQHTPFTSWQDCTRCGQQIVECVDEQGIHAFLNAAPDPLGKYKIAWGRGDHGEHLFHFPGLGMKGEAYYHAILIARYHGMTPLYSIHRCNPLHNLR